MKTFILIILTLSCVVIRVYADDSAPAIIELEDGAYLVEGVAAETIYAVGDDGLQIAIYLNNGSSSDGIYLYDITELTGKKIYDAESLVYDLWIYDGEVYFSEYVNPHRIVFAKVTDNGKVLLENTGYPYAPLFEQNLLFSCYEEPGETYKSGYRINCIAEPVENSDELLIPRKLITFGEGSVNRVISSEESDSFVFALEDGDEEPRIFRYGVGDSVAVDTGITGTLLGFAYDDKSLVVRNDSNRIIIYGTKNFDMHGFSNGSPVAFFAGMSQVYIYNDRIRVGNTLEGKSSPVDFELGKFEQILFYPISFKSIYFQIERSKSNYELYRISSVGDGKFEVERLETTGLIVDTQNRYDYYGTPD